MGIMSKAWQGRENVKPERRKIMPVFWILAVLFCIAIWFLGYFLYKPIGKCIKKILGNSLEAMKDEQEEKEDGKK
jgi:F0F1-type ATP synthase membrane subunit b/b'